MSPSSRELSFCYALLVNFVAAAGGGSNVQGVRRLFLPLGSARHVATSTGLSPAGSRYIDKLMTRKTPSGLAWLSCGLNRVYASQRLRGLGLYAGSVQRRTRTGWTRSITGAIRASPTETSASEGTSLDHRATAGSLANMEDAMKITLLSGFLGAGKTTLMRNVLRQAREQELALAVIVNDMVSIPNLEQRHCSESCTSL